MLEKVWIVVRPGLEKASILKDSAKIALWEALNSPVPPPSAYKQAIVREYATRFGIKTLVETGTWHGDMVQACLEDFEHIHSIELSENLALRAAKRFAEHTNVTIRQGDSANVLPKILKLLNDPAVFWLDAHYSEGDTVKGDLFTPIQAELTAILGHRIKNHVVLVDDIRCFVGQNDYPTTDELIRQAHKLRPKLDISLQHDIMRITLL